MPPDNGHDGKTRRGCSCKRLRYIRLTCTFLAAALVLLALTLALVAYLTVKFVNREPSLPPCPDRRATPSFLQIQVLGDCYNSAREVTVSPEKNPWVNELVDALRQIQAKVNGGSAVSNVVLNPKQNPWVNELISALREDNRSEHKVNVAVDLEKPAWVDDLIKAIHGALELHAIDPAIRAEVKEHLKCPDKRLSVSDIIRFPIGEYSLDDPAETGKIDNFVMRIDKRASKWGVFGFASESGGKEGNRKLSWQRACEVTKYICGKHDCESSGIDCIKYPKGKDGKEGVVHTCTTPGNQKTEFLIRFLGEDHFINGVADSRSVVIVACKRNDCAEC